MQNSILVFLDFENHAEQTGQDFGAFDDYDFHRRFLHSSLPRPMRIRGGEGN